MERTTAEIAEIERHKYFLSEKRGYDVGWEYAEQDWEECFGDQFRSECDGSSDSCDGRSDTMVAVATETKTEACVATRVDTDIAEGSCSSSVPAPRWRRFLSKLWSK